jgi:hypothetical protein
MEQGHIDILKLDIEGAEQDLFASNYSWLARVNIVIIELHEKLIPNSSAAFYSAASDFTYLGISGENAIFVRALE